MRRLHAAAIVAGTATLAVGGYITTHHQTPPSVSARSYPPKSVPGALATPQPTVAQLCTPGYTATIRPPASYTTALKVRQMAAWRLPGGVADYEEDHLVPLELGGHPTSEFNLWPEPWNGPGGAHAKDVEENQLHRAVCAGTMSLVDAQHRILVDWGPR
jgi:hypothetical protein